MGEMALWTKYLLDTLKDTSKNVFFKMKSRMGRVDDSRLGDFQIFSWQQNTDD